MNARFGLSGFLVTVALLAAACSRHAPPPYDNPPVLANRDEITEAMRAVGAGLEAQVVLLVRVDEQGYVQDVSVAESSGDRQLDDAAVWIGERMRFEPARYEGEAVPCLARIPVTFDVVTQLVREPRLRNAESIVSTIIQDFADLRGTARLRVEVDPKGTVLVVRDRESSAPEALRAARRLTTQLVFWPAVSGGREVTAWVEVVFEFRGGESRVYVERSPA